MLLRLWGGQYTTVSVPLCGHLSCTFYCIGSVFGVIVIQKNEGCCQSDRAMTEPPPADSYNIVSFLTSYRHIDCVLNQNSDHSIRRVFLVQFSCNLIYLKPFLPVSLP